MTKKKTITKKVVNKLPEDIGNDDHPHYFMEGKSEEDVVKKKNAKKIILQQCKEGADVFSITKAHFLISKAGVITKGLDIDKNGQHCKGNNDNSIGIVIEGKFSRPQQKALMNIFHEVFTQLKNKPEVKPYHVFHPGKVNPNINIRSVLREYGNNYENKTAVRVIQRPRLAAKNKKTK